MSESYVDLTYRGLALGRRVKLAQIRPSTAYLEVPQPMPVGTQIAIITDDGLTFEASVMSIQEQVGAPAGGTQPIPTTPTPAAPVRIPGMLVKPTLGEAAAAWWKERVALPELEATVVPARGKSTTVRPRSRTIPEPMRGDGAGSAGPGSSPAWESGSIDATEIGPPPDSVSHVKTQQMPTVVPPVMGDDPTGIGPPPAELSSGVPMPAPEPVSAPVAKSKRERTRTPPRGSKVAVRGDDETAIGAPPTAPVAKDSLGHQATQPMSRSMLDEIAAAATVLESAPIAVSAEHSIPEIIDDGKRTIVMDAVDPEMLANLGIGDETGSTRATSESDVDEPEDASGATKVKTTGGSVKRRRKKRS